jgi:hypothetical protein
MPKYFYDIIMEIVKDVIEQIRPREDADLDPARRALCEASSAIDPEPRSVLSAKRKSAALSARAN